MWLTTPTVESVTRPRLAVAVVSAVAAASICYYVYTSNLTHPQLLNRNRLHRSNAVRRSRRNRPDASLSSSSDEAPADENADIHIDVENVWAAGEGETVVTDGDDDWAAGLPSNQRAGHNIVALLFRVSEDNARRNGCVHRGCQCNACGMVPIRGVRYRCANCADFDLCETCESQGVHTKTHIFYKIRVPAPPFGPRQMQPIWYTGDPETCRRALPRALIAKLTRDTGFERPELEAFWEQWTFMANTEWRDDPDELGLAMDRKTFERCLVPTGGSRHAAPNLIHDRMFAFYDWNKDGLIGFTEFLTGLSYRKRKDKLRKVFEGYDIDGDGLVNRKDFLRMFRAYYVLYKQMHKDILDGLEDQLLASTEAQQLVASRQPLSSIFGREGRVPRGDPSMRLAGKTVNPNGSVHVEDPDQGPTLASRGDTAGRQDILTSLFACQTEQSRWRMFERAAVTREEDYEQRTRSPRLTEADRPYLVTLIEPPASLEELPDAIMGDHTLEIDDAYSADEYRATEDTENDPSGPQTETDFLIRGQNYARRRMSKMEKRRRDMARARLHDRWQRRQFYLDEEEGGEAPDDWNEGDDIFVNEHGNGESSKPPFRSQSRASPELFVDDAENYEPANGFNETPSNASTSPRHMQTHWSDFVIHDPERDAGKEILYQVTQQAFNELLDTIFKPSEDIAVKARETRKDREEWQAAIDAVEMSDDDDEEPTEEEKAQNSDEKPPSQKSLKELLEETGFEIITDDAGFETLVATDPRNAVNHGAPGETVGDQEEALPDLSTEHDPTLPQFRPNTPPSTTQGTSYPFIPHPSTPKPTRRVSKAVLQYWKRLTIQEQRAKTRGGWGKLSFDEFEDIYRSQEYQGNRLDYLGSWIDFCIP